MTHPAAYLPVNIGERTRFEAHGQSFLIGYHSRNTYWLSTDPPGERRRWGTRQQITEDIAYVFENGVLPPASRRMMWAGEAHRYAVPPEPPHHHVAPRVGEGNLTLGPPTRHRAGFGGNQHSVERTPVLDRNGREIGAIQRRRWKHRSDTLTSHHASNSAVQGADLAWLERKEAASGGSEVGEARRSAHRRPAHRARRSR